MLHKPLQFLEKKKIVFLLVFFLLISLRGTMYHFTCILRNPFALHCFRFFFRGATGIHFGMLLWISVVMRTCLRALSFLPEFELRDSLKQNQLLIPLDTNVCFKGSLSVRLGKMSLSKRLHVFYKRRPNPKLYLYIHPVYPVTTNLILSNRLDLILFWQYMHQFWNNFLNSRHCSCKRIFSWLGS